MRKTLKIQKSSKVVNGNQCYELLEGGKTIGVYISKEKAEDAKEKRVIENRSNRAVNVINSDLAAAHFAFVRMSIDEI
jgi:hypothetical protein